MKQCSECKKEFKSLWKAKTRDHGALCKVCWRKYQAQQESRSEGAKIGNMTMYSFDKYKKRKAISPISDKKSKELAKYRKLRDEYLAKHTICEAKIPSVCIGGPVELHHIMPRAYFLCDTFVFLAVCRRCHEWIEVNDKQARKMGLKVNHL